MKNAEGTRARGYTLATLRTLLASAGRLPPVARAAIQGHDMALCRPWREEAPVLRAGDLLLEARGLLDGATLSAWKRTRRVAVLIPLTAPMLAMREAIALAARGDQWHAPPARAEPRMALGRGVEHRWTEGAVPRHAGVIRVWHKTQKRTAPIGLLTTALELHAPWIVRHYEERPESEQDSAQRKSGGWQLQQRSARRYSTIVFYGLTVVLSYSL